MEAVRQNEWMDQREVLRGLRGLVARGDGRGLVAASLLAMAAVFIAVDRRGPALIANGSGMEGSPNWGGVDRRLPNEPERVKRN
jgi:hypothetical protein